MITSHPNTTIAIKGHAKELNCTARGERPIIIRWEKGDTVIDPDRVTRYTIATKDSGDEVVSTLKVSAHAPVPGEPTAITSASSGGKRGVQKYPPLPAVSSFIQEALPGTSLHPFQQLTAIKYVDH